ncbi:unnamed protein product [Absidia cylindrospora]
MNTGLTSPVMIIRKVDYGNSATGGMRTNNGLEAQHPGSFGVGGEYHDEDLGDPVSQLHKVAFQVVDDTASLKGCPGVYRQQQYQGCFYQSSATSVSLPYSTHPAKYLSCMKDVVGIYRTSGQRSQVAVNNFIKATLSSLSSPLLSTPVKPPIVHTNDENVQQSLPPATTSTPLPHNWLQTYDGNNDSTQRHQYRQTQELQYAELPLSQKRRLSCELAGNHTTGMDRITVMGNSATLEPTERVSTSSAKTTKRGNRRRYSSADEQTRLFTGATLPRRRNSILSSNNPSSSLSLDTIASVNWQEEISETCIWSIVSTDTATYTFWPTGKGTALSERGIHRPMTPVPHIEQWKLIKDNQMVVHGCGFTSDMVVWFGSFASTMVKVTPIELELLVPNMLLEGQSSRCIGHENGNANEQTLNDVIKEEVEDKKGSRMEKKCKVPILLVREGDGVVYRTQTWF